MEDIKARIEELKKARQGIAQRLVLLQQDTSTLAARLNNLDGAILELERLQAQEKPPEK